ncbi:MAG TPA: D-alanyl-D-alanine carboxypeptidase, partial [Segetibacter sp.]
MKTAVQLICSLLITGFLHAQNISKKLDDAVKKFEADSQMKNGILGFYVTNSTGAVVFDKNSKIGLAVASSQKVITSAASIELLGTGY